MKKIFIVFMLIISSSFIVFAQNTGPLNVKDLNTATAKAIAKYHDSNNYDYWLNLSSNDKEVFCFEIELNDDLFDLYVYIDKDGKGACFLIWDFVVFDETDYSYMMELVNEINTDYRYIKLNIEEDYTITLSCDCIFPSTGSSTVMSIFNEYVDIIMDFGCDIYNDYF